MTDTGTLRDQQAEFTKQVLLEAARKVIVQSASDEFTMQKVAEEAGVAYRTVYRYFPTKQALLEQFSEWIEGRFDEPKVASTGEVMDYGNAMRLQFDRFDKYADYFEPCARLSGGTLRHTSQNERTAAARAEFDEEFSHLDPDVADMAFGIIRHLGSLHTWYILRDRFGMKDGHTGEAVGWAITALLQSLLDGNTPGRSTPTDGGIATSQTDDE